MSSLSLDPHPINLQSWFSLFEILCGYRPFEGQDIESLSQHILAGQRRKFRPRCTVPRKLQSIIERGLETRPLDRFVTMQSLAEQLHALVRPRRYRRLVLLGIGISTLSLHAVTSTPATPTERCGAQSREMIQSWRDLVAIWVPLHAGASSHPTQRLAWRGLASDLNHAYDILDNDVERACTATWTSHIHADHWQDCVNQKRARFSALLPRISAAAVFPDKNVEALIRDIRRLGLNRSCRRLETPSQRMIRRGVSTSSPILRQGLEETSKAIAEVMVGHPRNAISRLSAFTFDRDSPPRELASARAPNIAWRFPGHIYN